MELLPSFNPHLFFCLQTTGLEIQQIELLNRGLESQTRNLEILSEEVQKIIVKQLVSTFNLSKYT